MTEQSEGVVGVLLAGGLSRRMGGGDKGLRDLGGKPMLAHVVDRLEPQVSRLIINANGYPGRFEQFNVPVVPDITDGAEGPLAGVLAGLKWAVQHAPHASHIVTASTDAPFLPKNLVVRLQEGIATSGEPIALAGSGGHRHPVIGLWPVKLATDLEQQLAAGVRKVVLWTGQHGFTTVDFPVLRHHGMEIDPFFNANTPEDLDAARKMLQTLRTTL